MGKKTSGGRPDKRPGFGSVFIRDFVQFTPGDAAAITNTQVEIDLDLDFESNEVFDIYRIRTWLMIAVADLADPDALSDVITELWGVVSEQPNYDREIAVTAAGDIVWAADPSLIHVHARNTGQHGSGTDTDLAYVSLVDMLESNFMQKPYTVGDNMTLHISGGGDGGANETYQFRSEIFGTRRRAAES